MTGLDYLGRVHVLGIGGAGMSAIARVLLGRGVSVSGSDARESRRVTALRALGATVNVGHSAANVVQDGVPTVDTLIVSTAVAADNIEVITAKKHGVRVLTRAEGLATILAQTHTVAVAGTHGKTTTTSMLTVSLQHCGADPSFIIGSELNESGTNAHVGTGDVFIVEADESDGTFLKMTPEVAIVTNVEPDHLDHWKTYDAIEDAFAAFVQQMTPTGFLVVCIDDAGGRRLAQRAKDLSVRVVTYGISDDADFRIEFDGMGSRGWRFDVVAEGVRLGTTELAVPGKHNVLNATAALAAGIGMGFPARDLRAGLCSFSGTRRRFDFRGEVAGVRVFDDYAHHPTEIEATLRAARDVVGDTGRVIVACQPYRWYRTAMFVPEYGKALALADEVVVLEVYGPGETPIPGASGQTIARSVELPAGAVTFEPSLAAVAKHLYDRVRPGDIVLTLGAEEVSIVGPELIELLRGRDRTDVR